MYLTFEELNRSLDDIVKRFDHLIKNGRYAEAMDILRSVAVLVERTYKVPLDNKDDYDHVFHEAYKKFKSRLDYGSVPTPEKASFLAMDSLLTQISDTIFKTAEVREKVRSTPYGRRKWKESLGENIERSQETIKDLERTKAAWDGLKIEIFGSGSPDLNEKRQNGKASVVLLARINQALQRIEDLENEIAALTGSTNPNKDQMIRQDEAEIANLINLINQSINQLEGYGVDVSTIRNITDKSAMTRAQARARVSALEPPTRSNMVNDYTQILNNLKALRAKSSGYAFLQGVDLDAIDPTTDAGRDQIDNICDRFFREYKNINIAVDHEHQRIEGWEHQTRQLDDEERVLSIDTTDRSQFETMDDATRAKMEAEQREAHENNRDSIYGNDAKAEKYREYFRFVQGKIVERTRDVRDNDGNIHTITYRTLEDADTPEMKEKLKFLNIEDYKARLERVSTYEALKGIDEGLARRIFVTDLYNTERGYMLIEKARRAGKSLDDVIDENLSYDRHYVETYNGAKNAKMMKYENLRSAGSLLKGMIPLSTGKTGMQKFGIATRNVLQFLGLSVPQFKVQDADGNWVTDVKGGLATLGKDALVLGGYALGTAGIILSGPIWGAIAGVTITSTIPVAAAAAGAVGIVAAGKGVRIGIQRGILARRYKRKMGDKLYEPNNYEETDIGRRQGREDYYVDVEGLSRSKARRKARRDDWYVFNHDRRHETMEKMREARDKKLDEARREGYVDGAIIETEDKQEQARRNQATREAATYEVGSRASTYGDIYREPDEADPNDVKSRVVGAAAYAIEGREDLSEELQRSGSQEMRNTQFVRPNNPVGSTEDIDPTITHGRFVGERLTERTITDQEVDRDYQRRTDAQGAAIEFAADTIIGMGVNKALHKIWPDQIQVYHPGTPGKPGSPGKPAQTTPAQTDIQVTDPAGQTVTFESTGTDPRIATLSSNNDTIGSIALLDENGNLLNSKSTQDVLNWITSRKLNPYSHTYNGQPLTIADLQDLNKLTQIANSLGLQRPAGITDGEWAQLIVDRTVYSFGNSSGVQQGWLPGNKFMSVSYTPGQTIPAVPPTPPVPPTPGYYTSTDKPLGFLAAFFGGLFTAGPALVQHRAKQKTNTGLDYENLNRGKEDPREFTSPGKRHEGIPPAAEGVVKLPDNIE